MSESGTEVILQGSCATLRRLATDRGGIALIEFALMFPIILLAAGWSIELAFLARTNLQVSQFALNLGDNASRVGTDAGAGVTNLRETDVNDVLQGVKLEGSAMGLTTHGRVTMSSLENVQQAYDTARTQRIHWQRCIGMKAGAGYDSSYGTTKITDGTTSTAESAGTPMPGGMGEAGSKITAPPDSGVMFVEVNYEYRPLFGTIFMEPRIIRYVGSFMVRDNRNFQQLFNPSPAAVRMTCNHYTA